MTVFEAKMDTVFYDKTAAYENEECDIKINGKEIVVSYEDDEGVVIYRGQNNENGHFILTCPERDGRATLHQMPNSKFLEGYWTEEGERGFWRIKLP